MIWHYRIDSPGDGETNMQRDRDYYHNFSAESHPLLRFYRWSKPTLSLGRFQTLDPLLEGRLKALKIPTVRRPTGGQAILHGGDLCISLTGPNQQLKSSLIESHQSNAKALILGLQELGLKAYSSTIPARYQDQSHCFATTTPADIQIESGKVIGSAQMRCRKAFLQQSVLYLHCDQDLHFKVFQTKNKLQDLSSVLITPPQESEIIQAILKGFSRVFQNEWLELPAQQSE